MFFFSTFWSMFAFIWIRRRSPSLFLVFTCTTFFPCSNIVCSIQCRKFIQISFNRFTRDSFCWQFFLKIWFQPIFLDILLLRLPSIDLDELISGSDAFVVQACESVFCFVRFLTTFRISRRFSFFQSKIGNARSRRQWRVDQDSNVCFLEIWIQT